MLCLDLADAQLPMLKSGLALISFGIVITCYRRIRHLAQTLKKSSSTPPPSLRDRIVTQCPSGS
jgi:hypothetical protein